MNQHARPKNQQKLLLFVAINFCLNTMNLEAQNNPALQQDVSATDILLAPWSGKFGGLPPFESVNVADFKPALQKAITLNLNEMDAIASQKEPATFENTIRALEQSGLALERVRTVYEIWGSNKSTADFQAVEEEMEPQLAALSDKIYQNEALFKRIESVYKGKEFGTLNAEQQRLCKLYYTNFVRSGAQLNAASKKRLAEINQQLAGLFTRFGQNLLHDESEVFLILDNAAELDGLSAQFIESAALTADRKGLKGKYVISNTRSSVEPFLTFALRRDLREKAWKMFINRGDNGDQWDNNKIISEILNLRSERAALLGFESHAHWRLDNTMAKSPANAMKLMESVWQPAVERVKEEVRDMQAIADAEGMKFAIEPWDYRFYAEKVRKARFDLDQNEIKPYLQLDNLREGMFWVAGELFGFEFKVLNNIPVFHPDVQVYEVVQKSSGKHVGLWYFDPYAREGKRSGAWMNAYRNQSRINGKEITTIVSNNSNFVKGKPGEAVLISWDDATTLFHEFGHALHGLCSNVTYPGLSGTSVVRDYVEFPSQLLEHWLATPQVLQRFALHYQTGKPIPEDLVKRIEKASTFNEGFATVEFLSSALVDMKYHLSKEKNIDADRFERETLAALGMPREIVMRHRSPQFAHIFSSDGYSAGYYSYLWSDVLTADAFEAFTSAGGPYDKNVAKALFSNVFSVGNTIDPELGYNAFRGKPADSKALMRKRGFPVK
jgi:peptidyl-dipeptidase Dcp